MTTLGLQRTEHWQTRANQDEEESALGCQWRMNTLKTYSSRV